MRFKLLAVCWVLLFSYSGAEAYPSQERKLKNFSQPPLDFGFGDTASCFVLSSNARHIVMGFGETIKIIDTATFELSASQPPALSKSDNTNGVIKDCVYFKEANDVYFAQDDGDLIRLDLDKPTEKVTRIEISKGAVLGPLAVDPDTDDQIYVVENQAKRLHVYDISDGRVARQIALGAASGAGFQVLDAIGVADVSGGTDEIYLTTDGGEVLFMAENGSGVSRINVDVTGGDDLTGIAAKPDSTAIYVTNTTDKTLHQISTATHTVSSTFSVSANGAPTHIVVTSVTNPTATYGFVSGPKGMSIFDTVGNDVFDLGSDTTVDDEPLALGATPKGLIASKDGYLYVSSNTGKVLVLSDNPFLAISSTTVSPGSDATLNVGESVTLKFQADEAGTFTVRAGGSIDQSGNLLKFSDGTTEGSVSADSEVSVTMSYNDNKSALAEGGNEIFVFVKDKASSPNVGRDRVSLTVDTPPDSVKIQEILFGNQKLLVVMRRLTAADIKQYNIYIDTDRNQVSTKTAVAARKSQASSGDTITGEVTGLVNDVSYFVAVEAEDNGGNKSTSRTTALESGDVASGLPEATVGPAGISGETGGCSLIRNDR